MLRLLSRCKWCRPDPSIVKFSICYSSFPGGAGGKEPTCHCRRHNDPFVRKIPWRRKCQPTLVVLSGKPHGQKSLTGYSSWDCKESVTTEHIAHLLVIWYNGVGLRLWTSILSITWEPVRNASLGSPQTYWLRTSGVGPGTVILQPPRWSWCTRKFENHWSDVLATFIVIAKTYYFIQSSRIATF